jgi:group I intron endonuclease
MTVTPGIYSIVNRNNGRRYVGSALNVRDRVYGHIWHLRKGSHRNKKLQNAWRKHGEGAFSIEVLEAVSDPKQLLAREQHWIDAHSSSKDGYNLNPVAGSNLGRVWTPEFRAKVSAGVRRYYAANPENRERISKATRIGMNCPEVRSKCSAALSIRWSDEALRSVMMSSRQTPEAIKRKSDGLRRYWKSVPEEKRKAKMADLTHASLDKYRTMPPAERKTLKQKRAEILRKVCVLGSAREYSVVFPDGKTEEIFNLKNFCRLHSIPYPSAMNCLNGRTKLARGFKFGKVGKC